MSFSIQSKPPRLVTETSCGRFGRHTERKVHDLYQGPGNHSSGIMHCENISRQF